MTTFQQKLIISLGSALVFTAVNLPCTYKITNNVLHTFNATTNCPTNLGLLVHAVVFFLLTFLSMGNPLINSGVKLKHTIYGTLIFFLISSPTVYSFVGSILGPHFADVNGCPTLYGLLLHALVYCLVLVAVMYLPEKN